MTIDYDKLINQCLLRVGGKDLESLEKAVTEWVYDQENQDLKDKHLVIKEILNRLGGYDFIQALMEKEGINEIMLNGGKIFYEEKGRIKKSSMSYSSNQIERLVSILCKKADRSINLANPIMDGSIGSDTRVSIVLDPISPTGTCVTIRRFPKKHITYQDMIKEGFMSQDIKNFLERIVKRRKNIFICGGAGCGKTTLLNVMTSFIPKEERVITIEDSMELDMDCIDNIVRLVCRNPNSEGKGEVDMAQLIRSSLRMRPDRIIVGEVRGSEALYMLQAMNTGHLGSISTGHANSCKDAFSRLETMVLGECDMPLYSIRKQIADALDLVISLERFQGKRRIIEIGQVKGFHDNNVEMETLFYFDKQSNKHVYTKGEPIYDL